MKKFLLILLALVMCVSMCACSEDKASTDDDDDEDESTEEVSDNSDDLTSDEPASDTDYSDTDSSGEDSSEPEPEYALAAFDFSDAVTVSFSGRDTYGTAEMTVDSSIPYDISSNVSLSLSETEKLSNGQKITLNISYDPAIIEKKGYKIASDSIEYTVYGLGELKTIDAFSGLSAEFFGISPYCSITLNNAQCSEEAQMYVTYKIPEGTFANDDKVVITAEISEQVTIEHGYIIDPAKTTQEFTVSNMPYYITDFEGIDTSLLVSELTDYVTAEISFESKEKLFGIHSNITSAPFASVYCDNYIDYHSYYYYGVNSVISSSADLLTIKAISEDKFTSNKLESYNSLRIVARCSAVAAPGHNKSDTFEGDIYICFNINNIIAYPDGSIAWGNKSPTTFDIGYVSTLDGVDTVKAMGIAANAEDYNINSVTKTDWINIVE